MRRGASPQVSGCARAGFFFIFFQLAPPPAAGIAASSIAHFPSARAQPRCRKAKLESLPNARSMVGLRCLAVPLAMVAVGALETATSAAASLTAEASATAAARLMFAGPPQSSSCLTAAGAARRAGEDEGPFVAYSQCMSARPAGGMTGAGAAEADCAHFARLWQVAADYGEGLSPPAFCASVERYRGEGDEAVEVSLGAVVPPSRGACIQAVSQSLESTEARTALRTACQRSVSTAGSDEVCERFDKAQGRYAVRLPGHDKPLALKGANLELAEAEAAERKDEL